MTSRSLIVGRNHVRPETPGLSTTKLRKSG
jgi:hypothetical protein